MILERIIKCKHEPWGKHYLGDTRFFRCDYGSVKVVSIQQSVPSSVGWSVHLSACPSVHLSISCFFQRFFKLYNANKNDNNNNDNNNNIDNYKNNNNIDKNNNNNIDKNNK